MFSICFFSDRKISWGQNSEKHLKPKEELYNCSHGATQSKDDSYKKTVVLENNL